MTREIVRKEARDLAPAALGVTALGAGTEALSVAELRFALPALALLCAALGVAVGIAQGLVDRRRRDDPFLLHRPASPVRIHAARGAVGAAYAALAGIAAVAVVPLVPSQYERMKLTPQTLPAGMHVWQYDRVDPTFAEALVCVAGAVVFHAVGRLALSARRALVAVLLLVVLVPMVLYALLSIGTASVPWLAFAAALGVCTALGTLNLARRPA